MGQIRARLRENGTIAEYGAVNDTSFQGVVIDVPDDFDPYTYVHDVQVLEPSTKGTKVAEVTIPADASTAQTATVAPENPDALPGTASPVTPGAPTNPVAAGTDGTGEFAAPQGAGLTPQETVAQGASGETVDSGLMDQTSQTPGTPPVTPAP